MCYSLSIAFSYTKYLGKGSKLALIFDRLRTGHAPHLLERIRYACTALWERLSLRPSKLAPPVFQTGTYFPNLQPKFTSL